MMALGYIANRVGTALITVFGVCLIVFIAMRLLPGGFEKMILGQTQTEEVRAALTAELGLDRSAVEQYFRWMLAVLHGDFGRSQITRTPVADELLLRAPATLQLALMSLILTMTVGLPLGVLSAIGSTSRSVRVGARLLGALGASTPEFVLGTVLVYVFSVWSLGLTVGGYVPFMADPLTNLRAMILPTVTLSIIGIALMLRTTRDAVLVVMTGSHITAAVGRGESPAQIMSRQVLRNASLPVLTVGTMYFSALLGGSFIVETLFTIPGVGLYTWNSLNNRDYAVTQSAVLILSVLLVAINMVVDIAYALLDPRIRTER